MDAVLLMRTERPAALSRASSACPELSAHKSLKLRTHGGNKDALDAKNWYINFRIDKFYRTHHADNFINFSY